MNQKVLRLGLSVSLIFCSTASHAIKYAGESIPVQIPVSHKAFVAKQQADEEAEAKRKQEKALQTNEVNQADFYFALQTCKANTSYTTRFGKSIIKGLEDDKCHVIFAQPGKTFDCNFPVDLFALDQSETLAEANKKISFASYCESAVVPMTPEQLKYLEEIEAKEVLFRGDGSR